MKRLGFNARGKECKSGQWRIGFYSEKTEGVQVNPKKIVIKEMSFIDGVEVKQETCGRFSFVYDRNGAPVFEGDVIEWKMTNGTLLRGVVRYHASCASFFIFTKVGTRFLTNRRGIVIGNVIDNPKLMNL